MNLKLKIGRRPPNSCPPTWDALSGAFSSLVGLQTFFSLFHPSLNFLKFHSNFTPALTITSRTRVGYELAISISYPTSTNGVTVLLKTPPKYRKLLQNKNKNAPKLASTLAILVEHGVDGSDNPSNTIGLTRHVTEHSPV